jgi:hypothetical protein
MAIQTWQPGTTYIPGQLVAPIITPSTVVAPLVNAGFESGDTDWTKGADWSIDTTAALVGAWGARHSGTGTSRLLQSTSVAIEPGVSLGARCYYNQGDSPKLTNQARAVLVWLDGSDAEIGMTRGEPLVSTDAGPRWQQLIVTGTAPAGTAGVRLGIEVEKENPANVWADQFLWNYVPQPASLGLAFKAVQAEPAVSGDSEPAWPTTVGGTVADGGVTWEAVQTSRVVWQARPILTSGSTEPDWPTVPGAVVVDGNIAWTCISRRVEDPRCPHGPYTAIVASKVYCADGDIIRYSATVNPLDWSSPEDAGYLPYGLQQFGANPITGLSIYRSNLVAFNSQGFQMWQVDEDPANSALLDSLPVGSIHHWALTPVSNDLFFLSDQGVRTIGIAASSTNLQAGDVGMPVDPITQPVVQAAAARGVRPLGTYLPGEGQYWLTLPDGTLVLIGNIPDGRVGDSYNELFYALRGVPPYFYSQAAGSMPPGLSFDPETQRVTGIATTPGVFYVTLRVIDSEGNVADSPQVVTILGEPPFMLASNLYPIEVIESLEVEGDAIRLQLLTQPQDSIDVGASLQTIELRSVLQEYEVPAEAVDVGASLQSIALDTVLVQYDDGLPDELNVSATLTSIQLRTLLIQTTMDPEGINVGATLTGVTLT